MEKHPFHYTVSVVENSLLCEDHYLLVLEEGEVSRKIEPGQFVNLRIDSRPDLLLRRPFTVARARPDRSQFEIVYQVVGKGTKTMTELRPREQVDLLGPLGVGFHLPETPSTCLLIGGGAGIAPLWGLAEKLKRDNHSVLALIGFRSSGRMFGEEVFRGLGAEVIVTTDDGSYGLKGMASDHVEAVLGRSIDCAYLCGPAPMLQKVIPMLRKVNLKGEASLEKHMGCGYGVCLSCVVDIERNGIIERERVCKEGPVFPIDRIVL